MKKLISIFAVLIIGSFLAWAISNTLGLKVSSEIVGDYAGIMFVLIYVLWGAVACQFVESILKDPDLS